MRMALRKDTGDGGEDYCRFEYDRYVELSRYLMHGKHDVVIRHHQSVRCGGWLLWGVWNLTSSILIRTSLWTLCVSIALHACIDKLYVAIKAR